MGKRKARRIGVAILSAAEADGAARILAMVPAWSSLRDDEGRAEDDDDDDDGEEAAEDEDEGTTSLR